MKKMVSALMFLVMCFSLCSCEKNGTVMEESYQHALVLLEQENFDAAIEAFLALGDYKDSAGKAVLAKKEKELNYDYQQALQALREGNYNEAHALFEQLSDYKDAALYQFECFVSREIFTISKYNVRQETVYEYNNAGQLIRSIYYSTPNSKGEVTEYFYDNDGNMSSVSEDYWMYDIKDEPLKDCPSTETAEYNEYGDVVRKTTFRDKIMPDGTRQTEEIVEFSYRYEYNEDGTIAATSYTYTQNTLQSDGTSKTESSENIRTYEYEYDENGRVLIRTEHNGNAVEVSEYSYDAFGNLISVKLGDAETIYEYTKILTKQDTE